MVTHSSYSAIVSTRRMTTESLESDGRGVDGEEGIIELESIIDAVIPPTESSRRRSGSMLYPTAGVIPPKVGIHAVIPPTESSRRRSGSMLSSHRRSHPAEGRDPCCHPTDGVIPPKVGIHAVIPPQVGIHVVIPPKVGIHAVIPPTESSRRRSGSIDEPQCAVTSSFNDPAPKVFPSWIEFLDDVEFPLARPSLYRLLACDRVDHIAVLLVPD